MISEARLKELLHYNPDTGHFTWLVDRGRLAKAGQRAGTPHYTQGYIRVKIDGRMYQAHSLAILYMTGQWPKGEGDHINGVRDDNRWANLRDAPRVMNLLNRKTYVTSTSGHKGVNWHSRLGKWRVRIQKHGRRIALGCYDTLEEASAAYAKAADEVFGEYRRIEEQERKKA